MIKQQIDTYEYFATPAEPEYGLKRGSGQPSRFPAFCDVESVRCLDNFEISKSQDGYLMTWWGDQKKDLKAMSERSPLLAEALRSCERSSPFSFMQQKLRSFGLQSLDSFIFRQHDNLLKVSQHFGGDDPRAFGGRIGFTVRMTRQTVGQIYTQITDSPCAQEIPLPFWRFRWNDLPGGSEATFVVFRKTEQKDCFGEPLTNARMRRIFRDTYPNYPHGARQPELFLCFDATMKQVFIVTEEEFGYSIRLNPEEFEVRKY